MRRASTFAMGVESRLVMMLAGALIAGTVPICSALAALPMLSAGQSHTLALHADGTVRAWGGDRFGQLGSGRAIFSSVPVRVTGMPALRPGRASLAADGESALAIAADGSLWSWGLNSFGGLGDGTTTPRSTPARVVGIANVAAVAAGPGFSLAIVEDGTLWSWGLNHRGQLGDGSVQSRSLPARVPAIASAVAVSAGNQHAVALLRDGTVWAWGDNSVGQLGDGTTTSRSSPAPIAGLSGIRRVVAAPSFNLALRSDGTVWAWGYNDEGQIGDGTRVTRLSPVQVPGVVASDIAGGGPGFLGSGSMSYALALDATVWTWGMNNPAGPARIEGYSGITAICAGHMYVVGLRGDGTVWTSGVNEFGQLGRSPGSSPAPSPVPGLPIVGAASAGTAFVLAASADGALFSWGVNSGGQLGVEQQIFRSTPLVTVLLDSVTQVSAGPYGLHSLALRSDGTVWAWGSNVFGTLGNGTFSPSAIPILVPGLSQMTRVSAGGGHSVALRSDGTVWTWGANDSGQLGRGASSSGNPPAMVPGLANVVRVSAGFSHTVAVRSDGTVWAWGNNARLQLGVSTSETCTRDVNKVPYIEPCATRPLQVPGISNVIDVAAGTRHTLALRSDGTVWAWGDNSSGALGDGTNVNRLAPAPVVGLSGVVRIAAGGDDCSPSCGGLSHSMALKGDGTVWTWGENHFGQLGDGTTTSRGLAQPVADLSGVTSIAAGTNFSGAVARDGSVRMWGAAGALGDGTLAARLRPVVVVREDGAGSLDRDDWFLDLDPSASAPVAVDKAFAVVTQGNVEGARADVSAEIRYRAADVGSSGGVYVFALAPASSVPGAAAMKSSALPGMFAKSGGKDTAVACVLAQLNASGQLQAVSAAAVRAYVSGVFSAQGQAVTILDGVPTVDIGGATFFVGYGPSPSAMINGGTNRSVATVSGALECRPQAPKTGWWWDPPTSAGARSPRDGTGYSIEAQGSLLFFAAYLYDATGRSSWYVASGRTSLDGSLFVGDLLQASGGQSLGGAYKPFTNVANAGPITLAFNSAISGTMVWPGGTVPLGRFDIVPGGANAATRPNTPESGWWWNPAESGRGFFIEWQDGWADLAGYMYDEAGSPVWYITVVQTPEPMRLSGTWWSYGNGMTLTGPWQPHVRTSDSVAPVTVTFTSATTATMTLPNGRTTSLVRHRF